jgi:hypothetical protein
MTRIRVAAHVHSDWSYDGRWPLPALARAFARRRFRVVLMTEHDRGFDATRWDRYRHACARASTPRLLLVPGIEYSDPDNAVHVLTWGLDAFLGEGRPTGELLADVHDRGGLAVLAHPARRRAWQRFEPGWEDLLGGIELWNRKYDGWAPSDAARGLIERTGLPPFVGLDFHRARQFSRLAMVADVPEAVTADAVVAALRSGTGPRAVLGVPASRLAHGRGRALARSADATRRGVANSLRATRAVR